MRCRLLKENRGNNLWPALFLLAIVWLPGCGSPAQVRSLEWLSKGSDLLEQERFGEAREACRRSLDAEDNPGAHRCELVASIHLEDWRQAQTSLEALRALEPNDPLLTALELEIGRTLGGSTNQVVSRGTDAAAWACLDGACQWPKWSKDSPLVNPTMEALVLARLGRLEEADDRLANVDTPEARFLRALLLVTVGRLDEVQELTTAEQADGKGKGLGMGLEALSLFMKGDRYDAVSGVGQKLLPGLDGGDAETLQGWWNVAQEKDVTRRATLAARLASERPWSAVLQVNAALTAMAASRDPEGLHFARRGSALAHGSRVALMVELLACLLNADCDSVAQLRSKWAMNLPEEWRDFVATLVTL